jgi:hypothetical protein
MLLKEFRSVKSIREQPVDELRKIVGDKRARLLLEYFAKDKNAST